MSRKQTFIFFYSLIAITLLLFGSLFWARAIYQTQFEMTETLSAIQKKIDKIESSSVASDKLKEELKAIKETLMRLDNSNSGKPVLGAVTESSVNELLNYSEKESSLTGITSNFAGFVILENTKKKSIDVYKEASASSKVIGKMEGNKIYPFLKKENGWYLIRLDSLAEGWVNSQFIKVTSRTQ